MKENKYHNRQNWKIDQYQVMALTAAITFGAIIPFSRMGRELGVNIWQAVLISLFMGLIFCLVLISVIKNCPGKGLLAINNELYSKSTAKIINLILMLQFIFAYSYFLKSIIELWQVFGKEENTFWIIALVVIVLTTLAAAFGIEAISRVAMIVIVLFFLVFFLDIIMVLPNIDFARLLPVESVGIKSLALNSFRLFILEFSLFPMALIFTDYLKEKKEVKKGVYLAFIIVAFYIILNTVRNCLLLGDTIELYQYPVLQALRMVEWGPVFSRLEILGILVIVTDGLIFLMIANFIICVLGKEIFSFGKYQDSLLPFVVFEAAFLFFIKKYFNFFNENFWLNSLAGIFIFIFFYMIVTLIKGKRKQKFDLKAEKKEEKNLSW